MSTSVLVIMAHPDDEVLSCGGTIAKYVNSGASVHVCFMADGVSSRDVSANIENELISRRKAARIACDILGVQSVYFGGFPDNQMDLVSRLEIVKAVEAEITARKPEIVVTHHVGDLNVDHRRVSEAVVTACRPQSGHPVKTLLFGEVPSSTEWQVPGATSAFEPNWFIDVSNSIDAKMSALKAYDYEMRSWPHPRSYKAVKSLAEWRGATIGVDAAEAFALGRFLG